MVNVAEQPRKVLVFHNAAGQQLLKSQLNELEAAQDGFRERDIEIESIAASAQNAGKWKKWQVDSSEAFTFILVGRDGGEKLRSTEVVKVSKLFGLIDAMPMRRREMNE